MTTPETISGRIVRIRFQRDGFLIASLDDGTTIKGDMLEPSFGVSYQFRGRWDDHPKWGRQFHFDAYESTLPSDVETIRAYLEENSYGIGKVISGRIVDKYGDEALAVLKDDPARVAREIEGLSERDAGVTSERLRRVEHEEKIRLEVGALFAGLRMAKSLTRKVVKAWRFDAVARIKKNPYDLVEEIVGVGFLTADSVALNVKFSREAPERILAGIVHVLKEEANGKGHTQTTREDVTSQASELLKLAPELIANQLDDDGGAAKFYVDGDWVALSDLYEAEDRVAEDLCRLLLCDPIAGAEPTEADELADDQREALLAACDSPVFILTGAPGTGKTFTIKRIIDSFPSARVSLAAPTGKAAKRITEQTGLEALTIHRLLGPEPDPKTGEFRFRHGRADPLRCDLLILDETSMIDARLAAQTLAAVKDGCRLILVGDVYQLPSVGPGNVLRDVIASGVVPVVELATIKRQDPGRLVRNIHRIKDEQLPEYDNAEGDDYFFVQVGQERTIQSLVVDFVAERLPEKYGVDPVRDIQVITPLRKKTSLGCSELNRVLQTRLNDSPAVEGTPFRIGDKVVQLSNDYDLGIVNGDVGYVVAIDGPNVSKRGGRKITVEFENPTRVVEIGLKFNDLELAYALTCHKFQGSEAPIVVIPVHNCFGSLIMQRSWVYTAISRARDVCVVVGDEGSLQKAIARNATINRRTRLTDDLKRWGTKSGADNPTRPNSPRSPSTRESNDRTNSSVLQEWNERHSKREITPSSDSKPESPSSEKASRTRTGRSGKGGRDFFASLNE